MVSGRRSESDGVPPEVERATGGMLTFQLTCRLFHRFGKSEVDDLIGR